MRRTFSTSACASRFVRSSSLCRRSVSRLASRFASSSSRAAACFASLRLSCHVYIHMYLYLYLYIYVYIYIYICLHRIRPTLLPSDHTAQGHHPNNAATTPCCRPLQCAPPSVPPAAALRHCCAEPHASPDRIYIFRASPGRRAGGAKIRNRGRGGTDSIWQPDHRTIEATTHAQQVGNTIACCT